MDGFSILDGSWREPATSTREYDIGNAIGWLSRGDKQASTHHALSGRLYVAKSGWLLLSVPNALVRGVYDALTAPGAELPLAGAMNVPNVDSGVLNAHISVMTADEVKKIGAENINERGHMFGYSLGHLKEITPRNIDGISKVWALQVSAPYLSAIRKSYGLSPLLNNHPFHITVAVRRKNVLQDNSVRKAAAAELPWRERVEVLTRHPRTGKIYGGVWKEDKSFAAPGGGIDPGEKPEQAAIRELMEETGIQAANPVLLPVGPVDNPWNDEYRQRTGRNFAGSRTHFVAADFVKRLRNKNLDAWSATHRKFYTPEQAMETMKDKNYMAVAVAEGRRKALQHLIEQATKKQAAADILHGGEADNMPDSAFPKKELAEGKKHEHEHTDNDQIADEIAKDHLQEDPKYYEKVEEIEGKTAASLLVPPKPPKPAADETAPPEMPPPVTTDVAFGVVPPPALPPSGQQLPNPRQPDDQEEQNKQADEQARLLDELRAAKDHSDNKRYGHKTEILRRLMAKAPKDWHVDDPKPYHKGITHTPTKFKFHVEPSAIPASVKAAYRQPRSAYGTALYNAYGLNRPLQYNYNKTVAENIQEQLMQVKQRGDFMRNAKQNHQRYMAALDPNYRYQLAMKAMNNELEEEPMIDQVIGRYGDNFMNTIFGKPK